MRKRQEANIAAQCIGLMELDGWRHIDTDPKWLRGMAIAEKGIADSLFVRYQPAYEQSGPYTNISRWNPARAEVIWVEWKSIKGITSQKQHEWHTAERARGGMTWKAMEDFEPTVAGFWKHYGISGLAKKKISFAGSDV